MISMQVPERNKNKDNQKFPGKNFLEACFDFVSFIQQKHHKIPDLQLKWECFILAYHFKAFQSK
jgi:hypothetical protein